MSELDVNGTLSSAQDKIVLGAFRGMLRGGAALWLASLAQDKKENSLALYDELSKKDLVLQEDFSRTYRGMVGDGRTCQIEGHIDVILTIGKAEYLVNFVVIPEWSEHCMLGTPCLDDNVVQMNFESKVMTLKMSKLVYLPHEITFKPMTRKSESCY